MEDLAAGQGQVSQQRSGTTYILGKIDQAYAVVDEEQLKALSVTKFTYALHNNTYYRYDPGDNSGIVPDVGTGSWLEDEVSENVKAAIVAADQSNAEIKAAYEANDNTNAFTDTEQAKLVGIEAAATADQSNAEIKTAYEANDNTNAFTDAEQAKLAALSEEGITNSVISHFYRNR